MRYFLIEYDRRLGKVLRDEEFTDREAALRARFEAEKRHDAEGDVEIVVLGAESHDALLKTHGRYFKTLRELTQF